VNGASTIEEFEFPQKSYTDVRGWHAQRVTVEFALQFGDDQMQSPGRSCGRGYDRECSCTSSPNVVMRQIEQPLVVRILVDGRHRAADDAEVVLQNFDDGSQAVCGTGGDRNHLVLGRIAGLVVHS